MSTVTTATAPDAPPAPPPPTRSVPQALAEVADWRGDAVAVSSPGHELTYRQLVDGSRALAVRLLDAMPAGAAPDAPIALLAAASPSSVLATMAIVATGHPFVVLDTQLPVGRLKHVQEVARAVLCIADDDLAERAGKIGGLPVLVLDDEVAALDQVVVHDADLPTVDPGAAATVVFTSGSTGAPKGVIHSHRFLVAQAEGAASAYAGRPADYRVGALTSAAFVAGTAAVFIVLLTGGSLHLYDPRERGLGALPEWLRHERVTAISLTPSLLRTLVALPGVAGGLPDLGFVGLGGEVVLGRDVEAIWRTLGPCAVHVGYGTSETLSIAGTLYLPGVELPPGRLPAGRAIGSKTFEVVDDDGRAVPPGVTGVLRVTGPAHLLSDGYLNAPPELNRLFSANPDGSRSFLLRDLVRMDDEGLLHVVGRADDMVKVRGYLVEPAEVEDALRALDGIAEAAVIAVPSGATSSLVGYVAVAGSGYAPSPASLRLALRAALPDWMVPAEIVVLTSLPRNERGKVDRAALPRPVRPPFEAARGVAEQVVSRMWSDILGRDDIGRRDSFLALGGDSLGVEELITRLRTEHGVVVTTATVVEHPTVADFAPLLTGSGGTTGPHASRTRTAGTPELVVLRATGTAVPLFCVCGAGGSGRAFWPLAQAVGDDQPVYALQPHGMEGAAVPSFTITMAARRYLRTIRRVQPHGPYFLAGHSMGGLIALEIARRLRDAGEEVRPVVLLDTSVPPRALGAGIGDVLGLVLRSDAGAWVAPALDDPSADAVDVDLLREGPRRNALGVVRGAAGQAWSLLRAATDRVPLGAQEGTFFWFGARVSMLHRPKPWSGDAVVLRTAENLQPAAMWTDVVTGALITVDVPGNHTTMLRPPYVESVVAQIEALRAGASVRGHGSPACAGR